MTYREQGKKMANCRGDWRILQSTWTDQWEFHICTTARQQHHFSQCQHQQ